MKKEEEERRRIKRVRRKRIGKRNETKKVKDEEKKN
jgi:hypothetical protein